MKTLFIFALCSLFAMAAVGQTPITKTNRPDSTKKLQVVEAACGECQLGLKGNGCNLAVRIDGKAWYVDGTTIDAHGDAHAQDGFCNAIRKAEVQGEVIDNKFKVTYFKLIKPENKTAPKKM